MDIAQLLAFGVKQGASDLHLSAGLPPMIRVDGDIRRINVPEMDHKQVHDMIYDIMSDKQRKDYEEFLETDFSFEIPGLARFRVNAFNHNRGAGGVFRTIPSKILSLEDLNAPKIFQEISEYPRGIVLVTGPTGSGKSTTLAGMVDYKNDTEYGHILTVEDPIEFVHESKKCLVNQREDPGGRDARPRNYSPGAVRGRDRPPGIRYLAHQFGSEDYRPYRRRFPGGRKSDGPVDAVGVAESGNLANPDEENWRRSYCRA
jgi:pilus retraction protein PilT